MTKKSTEERLETLERGMTALAQALKELCVILHSSNPKSAGIH